MLRFIVLLEENAKLRPHGAEERTRGRSCNYGSSPPCFLPTENGCLALYGVHLLHMLTQKILSIVKSGLSAILYENWNHACCNSTEITPILSRKGSLLLSQKTESSTRIQPQRTANAIWKLCLPDTTATLTDCICHSISNSSCVCVCICQLLSVSVPYGNLGKMEVNNGSKNSQTHNDTPKCSSIDS